MYYEKGFINVNLDKEFSQKSPFQKFPDFK